MALELVQSGFQSLLYILTGWAHDGEQTAETLGPQFPLGEEGSKWMSCNIITSIKCT